MLGDELGPELGDHASAGRAVLAAIGEASLDSRGSTFARH